MDYNKRISAAIKSFWDTKKKQGNVRAGKQLDAFLDLLTSVAVNAGVPKECIYLKNNHIPGYYRATKDWDLLIISQKGILIAAIELKSQVGSYGKNLNNRTEEALGSSDDFKTAYREGYFKCIQSPWLGYMMVAGKDEESAHVVRIREPHYKACTEFKNTSYLERYKILCERLLLEQKYTAVALIATSGKNHYESLSDRISFESFINSFRGHLLGMADEFKD